jgi:hypothetical protein
MDQETAKKLADGYRAYLVSGDGAVFRMFSNPTVTVYGQVPGVGV